METISTKRKFLILRFKRWLTAKITTEARRSLRFFKNFLRVLRVSVVKIGLKLKCVGRFKPLFFSGILSGLFMFFVFVFLLAPPTAAQNPPEFVPGEILVQFRSDLGLLNQQQTIQQAGFQTLSVSRYSGLRRVQVPVGQEVQMAAAWNSRPDVEFAELNRVLTTSGAPNDPEFNSKQWSMHNIGQTGGITNADINGPEAWDIETGERNIVIAIVDTGIDLDHEDLQANIWRNEDEIPGNGLDDDGNGFIDDHQGWDFCNTAASFCTAPNDNDPNDESGHGTHVAGIAGAVGNNSTGVAGVNWQISLMPVKVFDHNENASLASIAAGIDYAAANEANVINLSLGDPTQFFPCAGMASIVSAIQNAVSQGSVVVGASGNANLTAVNCPAALTEVIATGATTDQDTRWSLSNRGIHLDVVAPGEQIYSTAGIPALTYEYRNGTSMAAPHVAGLAGLLWSYDNNLVAEDVRNIIEVTAKDLGDSFQYGQGRIDAYQALNALRSLQTSPSTLDFLLTDSSAVPLNSNLQLSSASPTPVTWTMTISPAASWLTPSTTSGTVSTGTSPATTALQITKPLTYGTYNTSVIITGLNGAGDDLGTRTTKVSVRYVSADLQVVPTQTTFLVDDSPTSVPASQQVALTTTDTDPINWQTSIPGGVSWLQAIMPTSGGVMASTAPVNVTLTSTRPLTYGTYSQTVVITGTNSYGVVLKKELHVSINYQPSTGVQYLPLILKNLASGRD